MIFQVKMHLLRNSRGIVIWDKQPVAKDMGQIQPRKRGSFSVLFIKKSSKLERIVLKESPLEESESSR